MHGSCNDNDIFNMRKGLNCKNMKLKKLISINISGVVLQQNVRVIKHQTLCTFAPFWNYCDADLGIYLKQTYAYLYTHNPNCDSCAIIILKRRKNSVRNFSAQFICNQITKKMNVRRCIWNMEWSFFATSPKDFELCTITYYYDDYVRLYMPISEKQLSSRSTPW